MPFALIPFLLLIVPIIEIAAFIAIGGQIGISLTLIMIFVTAIIGSLLLKQQGLHLINKIQSEVNAGKVPGKALGEAAMIMVAGILLLTPGFVTDAIGFLLFVPPVRTLIWNFVASRITVNVGGVNPFPDYDQPRYDRPNDADGPIIDLDEKDYEAGRPDPNSPWRQNDKGQ